MSFAILTTLARFETLQRAVSPVTGAIGGLVRAWVGRRDVTQLLDLDDRMLKDIGLVRSDVVGALAVRLAEDPSVVLRLRSVEVRARQRVAQAASPVPRMTRARRPA